MFVHIKPESLIEYGLRRSYSVKDLDAWLSWLALDFQQAEGDLRQVKGKQLFKRLFKSK